MDLHQAAGVAVAACVVAGAGLILALLAHLRMARLSRALRVLGAEGDEDALDALRQAANELTALRAAVARAHAEATTARSEVADSLRHVAVVRYDAFGDMGGRLSFSAALLDDDGDGLLLTSINGRSETRTYAKGVKAGRSEHAMSPEEEQAIGYARRGPTDAASTPRPEVSATTATGRSADV